MRDFYAELQVVPTAHEDVIHGAYRALARLRHPDLSTTPGAERRMKALNVAYDVLKDPDTRARYDADWRAHQMRERQSAIMPWGKHAGKRMTDLPVPYLAWLANNADDYEWREAASDELQYRRRPR